ncbi:MAG TPA: histidine kinase dimerization/phospho-acceptor domain-containing protein, partial [Cellvibrionaceae bacterium]
MMKTSSVKTELWRLILVPALSITLLLAATLTYLYTSQLSSFINDRGRLLTEKTSRLVQVALSAQNQLLLHEIISATLEEPYVRAVSIYDAEQETHQHWGPRFLVDDEDSGVQINTGEMASKTTEDSIRFRFPIVNKAGDEQIGTLDIELITSPFRVLLYQTLLVVVLATIACLLLASYLAIKLHHSITAPLGHINTVVHKLTKGQLGSRADTQLPHELAKLSHAINTMAEQLEQDQQEMQSNINQSMDDLRETMETIEIQNIELDIARKEALAASRIKSEFLANTSHEIRTPLNGIIGFTNLALKTSLDSQQRGYLQTIQDSATNLLKIINDILDFSKIESGKLVLDYTPLPLRQTIEHAVDSLAFDSQEKSIQIVTVIDNNIPPQLM